MSSPCEAQAAFVAALREPLAPPPADLTGRDGETPKRRFDVYRNNVHASLIDLLAARHPVTERLVGTAFFRAMAHAFVAAALPRSPVLIEYGDGFGAFIDDFEPAASLPYLGDVARLEQAWHEAYHAADAAPLEAQALTAVGGPGRLVESRLERHPSLRLVCSPWPVLAIWHTNTHDDPVRRIDLQRGGEDVLVLRPQWEVTLRQLPPGGATFLEALAQGHPLGAAAERAGAIPGFDLSANLRGLITAGGIVGIQAPEPRAGDPP